MVARFKVNFHSPVAANIRCFGGPILLVMVLLAVGGCLFEPRVPEPPTSGVTVPYLPRNTVAKNIWANLQLALNNSDSFGWEENVSPDFRYYPDQEAEQQFPGLFDDWNKENEMAFITNLFNSGVKIVAEMRDDDFDIPDDSGVEVEWIGVIYFLDVTTISDGSQSRFRASARITFRLEGNFWYIYSWTDQQGESDPDTGALLSGMGVLRGSFASK